MSSNTDKIKRLDLFLIKKGSSDKPKKVYTEKIKTLAEQYEYEYYSDFVSDGKPKEKAGEIIIKPDGTPPINVPPVINVKKIWNAKTGTKDYVVGGTINDVNGNLATVLWTLIGGTLSVNFVVAQDQQSIKFDVPEAEGQLLFNIEATDLDGAKARQDVEVNVKKEPDPEPQPTGIMFAYSADTDTTSEAEDIHNQIARENPDTWVFGGDGPYAKEGNTWTQMLDKTGMGNKKPFFTKGNHDTKSSESQQTEDDIEEWYRGLIAKFPEHKLIDLNTVPEDAGNPNWDTPDWLQTRIIGDVYLFSMNSEDMDIQFVDRNQYNWVTKKVLPEIRQLKAEGKINWAFAVVHKPWFTMKSSHGPEKATREIYVKLFTTDNVVDGILHGHNHNIQLWHPMALDTNNNAVAVYTFIENTQIYDFTKPRGLIVHINGAGGHENNGFTEPVLPVVRYANDRDDGYSLIYSDSEKKQLSIVIKKADGSILHTAIYSKAGTVEPDPQKPQLNLTFPSTLEVLKTGTIDATGSRNLDSVTVEQTTTQNIDLQQDGTNWKWNFTPPDINNQKAVTNTYSLGFRSEGRKGSTIIQKSVQITVTKTGTEPPGQYPIEFDKFYTSEQVLAQNDKTLQSSQYEIDKVCLPSGASGAKNHKLQNHRIVIDTGGGNGRIYWDYHRVNNKAIEQVPNFGFKHAFGGSFILGGDNLSVKIGNHGSDGREYDGKYVFGGFGFSLHVTEIQSKVEYWHNEQGSEVAQSYPSGRTLQKGKEYKFFACLILDPQSNEATLNVWLDFGDGAGYLNVMKDRKWTKSGWSPGSIPNGEDKQWIADGPGHIKCHTVWTRANSGSSTVWDLVYGIPK